MTAGSKGPSDGRDEKELGVVVEPGTVRFERILPGPIERVWAYLTEVDKRKKWLASGEIELRVGGRVELEFRSTELATLLEPTPERFEKAAAGGRLASRVTRCEPPRLLAFGWGESDGEESEVVFELTPRGSEVLLVLTHRRLADRSAMLDVSGGWHVHLSVLSDHLLERQPKPFWATLARAEDEYARRFASARGRDS